MVDAIPSPSRVMANVPRSLRSAVILGAAVLASVMIISVWGAQPAKPTLNSKVRAVASQLRCPICQGESVYDSPSGLAGSMRALIRQQLKDGQTSVQVERYFVSRYGQWILLAPPTAGIGLLVWFGPPALTIGGLLFLVSAAYAWRRNRQLAGSVTTGITALNAVDVRYTLDRLAERFEDGELSAEAYDVQRRRVERTTLTAPLGQPDKVLHRRQQMWPQLGIMLGAAVIIAATISLAVAPRGSAAITGSVPNSGSGPTPTVTTNIPKLASNLTALGIRMLSHRHSAGARLAFNAAIKLEPGFAPPRLELALLDVGQFKYRHALLALNRIASQERSSGRFWLLEGLAHARISGEQHTAIANFHRFLRLSRQAGLRQSVIQWINDLEHGKLVP